MATAAVGDKTTYGCTPIPGYDAAIATNALTPQVATKKEDEFGVIAVILDKAPTIATQATGRQRFRFVSLSGTNTGSVVLGDIVVYEDTFACKASTSLTDGGRNQVCGVAKGAITAGNLGWVQISGQASVNTGGNSITDGDYVILSSVAKVGVAVAAGTASTYVPVGVATVTASGGFTNTYLMIPG